MDKVFGNARTRYVIPVVLVSALAPFFIAADLVPHWLEADESAIETLTLGIASYAAVSIALWGFWLRHTRL